MLQRVPKGPGDGGKGVVIPPDKQAESKEKFKINQFNLLASDMMSLNRTLPDYRMDAYVLNKMTDVLINLFYACMTMQSHLVNLVLKQYYPPTYKQTKFETFINLRIDL